MATIVKMPAVQERRPRPVDRDNDAIILFFTGVRYVRDCEPESEKAASAPQLMPRSALVEEAGALAFV